MPYKDPEKAREAKRLSAARARAAKPTRETEADRAEDAKRKRVIRSRPPRQTTTILNLDTAALEARGGAVLGTGAMVDALGYQAFGRVQTIRTQKRSGSLVIAVEDIAAEEDDAPSEPPARRVTIATKAIESRHMYMRSRGAPGCSDEEKAWGVYFLLKRAGWIAHPYPEDTYYSLAQAIPTAAILDSLPRDAQKVARVIRRFRPPTAPTPPGFVVSRAKLSDDRIRAAAEKLYRAGLLELRDTGYTFDTRMVGYSIKAPPLPADVDYYPLLGYKVYWGVEDRVPIPGSTDT